MSLTEQKLLAYFERELGADISDIEPSTQLFSGGVIDSFGLVSLITFIEEECGFEVAPGDVRLENLDSVEQVLNFANREG